MFDTGVGGPVPQNKFTKLLRNSAFWVASLALQEFGFLFFLSVKNGIGFRLLSCLGRFLRWLSNRTCKFFSLKIEKVDRDGNRYLLAIFGGVRGVVA